MQHLSQPEDFSHEALPGSILTGFFKGGAEHRWHQLVGVQLSPFITVGCEEMVQLPPAAEHFWRYVFLIHVCIGAMLGNRAHSISGADFPVVS